MSNSIKKWGGTLLVFLLIFGGARLYYYLTDDFRLSNITYPLSFEAPWKVPRLTLEEHAQLISILNQPFTYLGKGAQSYAFESEDHQYVLKFFKFKHLKPNFLIEKLPSVYPFKEFKERNQERKKRKLVNVFNGYDLAYRVHRQESQLVYLHLVPTHDLHLQATIIDKMGWKRQIKLQDVVFLIQKKGETLRARLKHYLDLGQVEEAKNAIGSILSMYRLEYAKGIYDNDHGVLCNTGFVRDQPFHLDVGQLFQDERMQQVEWYKVDLQKVLGKMALWIQQNYPHYQEDLFVYMAEYYQHLTGEAIDIYSIDLAQLKGVK